MITIGESFVVITSVRDTKIDRIVSRAFGEKGSVPLVELEAMLLEGVSYKPFEILSDNPTEKTKLSEYKTLGFKVYHLINGMVYQRTPYFLPK